MPYFPYSVLCLVFPPSVPTLVARRRVLLRACGHSKRLPCPHLERHSARVPGPPLSSPISRFQSLESQNNLTVTKPQKSHTVLHSTS